MVIGEVRKRAGTCWTAAPELHPCSAGPQDSAPRRDTAARTLQPDSMIRYVQDNGNKLGTQK